MTKDTPIVSITFKDEGYRRIQFLHEDALVMTFLIANFTTHKVLVGNGNSVDILYYDTFKKM